MSATESADRSAGDGALGEIAAPRLRARATRGAAWSGVSSIVMRLGGLVVGIILARLLTPEQFGIYAIALTVQSILITAADLGLSADLIRSDEPKKIAPTIATLGLASGAILTAATALSSQTLAALLGNEDAAPAIAILSLTLLLAGGTVVPFGMLHRRFQQRELFYVGAADFMVSTIVTLVLVAAGFGVVGLAIGRVSAQIVSSAMQYSFARVRPRFAIDRSIVRSVLAFSIPVASANMLSWALLNVDYIILARVAGATALGFYVLAFNISSWPMTALGQVVRSVSLPYFSRAADAASSLATVSAVAWAGALPAGAILAVLAAPLIEVVYGARWLPAAPALAALGIYGSLRVVFDTIAGFLYSRGRSGRVLVIQVVWLVALVAGMIPATNMYGIVGAGWVHVIVAVAVILPAYALALRRTGGRFTAIARAAWWPTVATIPAVMVAIGARMFFPAALPALLVGGFASVLVYGHLVWPWLRSHLRASRFEEVQSASKENHG